METVFNSWLMKSPPDKKALKLFRPVSFLHTSPLSSVKE